MKKGTNSGFKDVLSAQLGHVHRILLEEYETSVAQIRKDFDSERLHPQVTPVTRQILKQSDGVGRLNAPMDVTDVADTSDQDSDHVRSPARSTSSASISPCLPDTSLGQPVVDINSCWESPAHDQRRRSHQEDCQIRPPATIVPQPPPLLSPSMLLPGSRRGSEASQVSFYIPGAGTDTDIKQGQSYTKRATIRSELSMESEITRQSGMSKRGTGDVFVVLAAWQSQKRSTRSRKRSNKTSKKLLEGGLVGAGVDASTSSPAAISRDSEMPLTATSSITSFSPFLQNAGFLIPGFQTLHPHSEKRFVWESLALILIMYDMAMVPLDFFDPPSMTIVVVMSWVIGIFWTLDIALSAVTGYIDKTGNVVGGLILVWKHYARTWLLFDATILSFSWVEILYGTAMGSTPRTLRALRMFRLIRMAKASSMMQVVTDRFSSDKFVTLLGISKILIFIIALTHCIACLFYGLSMSQTDEVGWVEVARLERASLVNRYLHSFHWSLTQFTGPDTEMQPQSQLERFFNILVLLFAFVVSAGFVSSITTSMTRLELTGDTQTAQFRTLHRYLCDNHISGNLVARVQRNVQHIVSERNRNINETEVDLLQLVSEPLKAELHLEIYMPVLRSHAHFRRANDVAHLTMQAICHAAVRPLRLIEGDVLFHDYELPPHPSMYFLASGLMNYTTTFGIVEVHANEWLSEANLWTSWMHTGNAVAKTQVRLLVVDADHFQSTAARFRTEFWRPELYAFEYVGELNRLQNMGKDPTDLHDSNLEIDRAIAVSLGEKSAGYDGGKSLLKKATTSFNSRPQLVRKMTNDLFDVLKKPFRLSHQEQPG